MARPCTICASPRLKEITADLMRRVPYRTIETRYGVSRSAVDRHLSGHVSQALQQLATAEKAMSLPNACAMAEPVLPEMRKLNARALRILGEAEAAQDRTTALNAIRECRRNLELIAKLTGELDPRAAGETPGGQLTVIVQYIDKQQVIAGQAMPAVESLPRLEAGGPECPH